MLLPLSLFLVFTLTLLKCAFSTATEQPNPVNRFHHSYARSRPHGNPSETPPAYYQGQTTSQIATVTSFANPSHLQTSAAARAQFTAAFHRGAGDPCGPQGHQTDFESTLNTCGQINTTYTHAPSRYGVQCLNSNPSWSQSINITSCASNMDNICSSIAKGTTIVSQWNWSSGVCIKFNLLLLPSSFFFLLLSSSSSSSYAPSAAQA